ncbi:hypothetical protein [Aeoliella mucimassa]|uniref:Uncharacterized protein n=1 Tax=Aeoliella mucimassa TaxID=2527972 RepID=A0A518AS39_9BACT|nr:hypothetical protein [Aeoliella mucimassa]QDU57534.1 hypothetical protein Pan181_37520 [Aeoliella mucimassa]
MTTRKFDNSAIDLSQERLSQHVSEYSFEEALANGLLVNVTSWVRHEMGFGTSRYNVKIAVTARLWKTIVRISPLAKVWQTVVGRGNDVLWLAAYAMHRARQVGEDAANFQCFLPTEDDWGSECVKPLRVELCDEQGKAAIVIGYVEEFAML